MPPTLPDAPGPGAEDLSEFDAAADELRVLARLLAFGPGAPLWEDSRERMLRVIEDALQARNDPMLARALELASPDGPALGQLLRHIEEVAGNPVVEFRGRMEYAELIVIPLLVTQKPMLRSVPDEPGAPFDDFAGSIEDAGLVGNATVAVVNYLYHPRELARLLPSQVSRLAQHVLDANGGGPSSFAALGETGWPSQDDPMPDTIASLHCLLAVAVGERGASRRLGVLSPEAEDQMLAAIEEWAQTAIDRLAACLGLNAGFVHVLGFDSFFDGLRFGLKCLRDLGVHSEIAALLGAHSMVPRALTIVLCSYGDTVQAREVRMSVVSRLDGALLLGKAVHVEGNGDATETIMRITRCMRFCGIEDIGIVPEVQPLEQGGDGKGPVFLTPRDLERVSGDRSPPPPELDERRIH